MTNKILIIFEDDNGERTAENFRGDELTSAISEAIKYLQELQQKEMVV